MDNLVSQGFSLMAFGMGFVFIFLTLLVMVTSLMSKVVRKLKGYDESHTQCEHESIVEENIHNELIAVMAVAIKQVRSKRETKLL